MQKVGVVLAIVFAYGGRATGASDEITELPGLSFKPNFKHYSGYLQASPTRFHHYWFVESQSDPSSDPLVFWFNGGPGCSSMEGLLAEHGPFLLADDGKTLKANRYAWNKEANVVYTESPAGVGFSYATEGDDGVYNDARTSAENYAAIKQFLGKYPQFRNRSLFIAGESYGGMYMPTLAERIIDGQAQYPINFAGVAIGNGLLNWDINQKSQAEFWYAHGFVDSRAYKALVKCCDGSVATCDDTNCSEEWANASIPGGINLVNLYDIYRDCKVPLHKMPLLMSTKMHAKISLQTSDNVPLCNPSFSPYLNQPEVRKALHIPGDVGDWTMCSGIHYQMGTDVTPQVLKIVNSRVRLLLYYGDTDGACNFFGGQAFVTSLGLKEVASKQAWYFNELLGGAKTEYEKNLTFITVRGVGHMVPQWQPAGAQYFIQKFLRNEPI